MSSHIDILRSKAHGCEWAALLAKRDETRQLFYDLARQYHDMADQVERLNKLQYAPQIDALE